MRLMEDAKRKFIYMPCLLMLAYLITLVSPPELGATIYSTISGYVMNADTQQPIAGIEIIAVEKYAENPRMARASSNNRGIYVLKDMTPGSYSLFLGQNVHYYFEDKKKEVRVIQGKNVVALNFSLRKVGSISGKVFQGDGVTPYANIGVVAQAPGDYILTSVTDTSGAYKIEELPQTTSAFVTVLAPGMAAVSKSDIQITGG